MIKAVVLDLDNTLYDWISFFVPAFYALVEKASEIMGVEASEILDDLRTVHQRHRNTEHPFALLETKIVKSQLNLFSPAERKVFLDPAFHAFNRTRKHNLQLYPGVVDTLTILRNLNVPVVAYTDARAANALFRIEKLNLDRFITSLYTPENVHAKDPTMNAEKIGLRLLPSGDKKPSPSTLVDICDDLDIEVNNCLYIGDSLVKDIYMAKTAGAHSAWARYGTQYNKELWSQLVRVTHWSDSDILLEAELRVKAGKVTPDTILDSFDQILSAYDFKGQ